MNIRKIKKEIKKLKCEIFKRQALKSLKLIRIWCNINHQNSKSNMMILTKNFWINVKFI